MAASRSTCCGGARIRTGGQDSLILLAAKGFLCLRRFSIGEGKFTL